MQEKGRGVDVLFRRAEKGGQLDAAKMADGAGKDCEMAGIDTGRRLQSCRRRKSG